MNVKFSQLPSTVKIKNTDIFPLLVDGENYIAPVETIYNYMSGDKLIQVYSQFSSNSSYLLNSAALGRSVYATFSAVSSNYILNNSTSTNQWNSNYTTTKSYSANWNSNYSYVNSVSSNLVFSNPTLVGAGSAIKNIVAITQSDYDSLGSKDPQTYYVIVTV